MKKTALQSCQEPGASGTDLHLFMDAYFRARSNYISSQPVHFFIILGRQGTPVCVILQEGIP